MPDRVDAVAARLPRVLQTHAEGLSREAIGRLLPTAGAAVLDEGPCAWPVPACCGRSAG